MLFGAEKDNKNWECLQVAQSKNNLIKEIEEVLTFMKELCINPQKLYEGCIQSAV